MRTYPLPIGHYRASKIGGTEVVQPYFGCRIVGLVQCKCDFFQVLIKFLDSFQWINISADDVRHTPDLRSCVAWYYVSKKLRMKGMIYGDT